MRTGDLNASVQSRSRSESPTLRGTRYPKEAGDRKANPGSQLAQSDRGGQASNVLTPVAMLRASQAGKGPGDWGPCWMLGDSQQPTPVRVSTHQRGTPAGTGWPGQLPGLLSLLSPFSAAPQEGPLT